MFTLRGDGTGGCPAPVLGYGLCLPDGAAVTVPWRRGRSGEPQRWGSAEQAAAAYGAELVWVARAGVPAGPPGPAGPVPVGLSPGLPAPVTRPVPVPVAPATDPGAAAGTARPAAEPVPADADVTQPTYRHNRRLDGDRMWLSGPGAGA